MGKEFNNVTSILEARGIDPKFSVPDGVDIVGVFQEYLVLEYVPEEGTSKEEVEDTMKRLAEAYNDEVASKVTKIYADFCEEYGIKVSHERGSISAQHKKRLARDQEMMRLSMELFG